uniref:Uncharacterized protein n=1 Tax=Heterorhabditis bacteriophora TaxID=37862 RepID=A0A1I7WAJ7_HETBA
MVLRKISMKVVILYEKRLNSN